MAEQMERKALTSTVFEDLSGISTSAFSNPYDALLSACNNDPEEIQARYSIHRTTRNAQQKAKMLDKSFEGVIIDPILLRLTDHIIEPGYVDPRHCLVFWARPTQPVKDLILRVQKELQTVAPKIDSLVQTMRASIPSICDHTFSHRTRLIKPRIGFDASAIALSFVPAASTSSTSPDYTYHHLRRDIYDLCSKSGVQVDSRYVVPSSHLTIGRFINPKDFEDAEGNVDAIKIDRLIRKIEEVNDWLEKEFWPERNGGTIDTGGEWNVGEEKGLDCRMGTLWYGDGETVHLGRGY